MAPHAHDHQHDRHAGCGGAKAETGQARDPVCGMSVDPATAKRLAEELPKRSSCLAERTVEQVAQVVFMPRGQAAMEPAGGRQSEPVATTTEWAALISDDAKEALGINSVTCSGRA